MLMNIKCSAVTSIAVNLTYDNGDTKEAVVGVGDLVNVEFNANGMRKTVDGKVLKISAVGVDPKGWYIIVDASDSFGGCTARFSPMSILDISIIRKADTINVVQTPVGCGGIPYIRVVKNRLQWSENGFDWHTFSTDKRDIIEDAAGLDPEVPGSSCCDPEDKPHTPEYCAPVEPSYDDGIEDAVY